MSNLPDDLYKIITSNVPIVCVDLIPVRKEGNMWQIGIITRATGPEAGKPAIVGGRIQHNELIDVAATRHLVKDLGINHFKYHEGNSVENPFFVQQYVHRDKAELPQAFDPTKHSIALTYLIKMADDPRPLNEAGDFYWIDEQHIPVKTAYNHSVVMRQAFDFLYGKNS